MADITLEDRIRVLEVIRDLSATPGPDPSDFFVLRKYEALASPKRLLVLGAQGTGKTALFRVLTDPDGFQQVCKGLALTAENCTVVPGYCRSNCFPAADILDRYTTDKQAKPLWIGSLLCTLAALPLEGTAFAGIMSGILRWPQAALFQDPKSQMDPSRWIGFVAQNRILCIRALDAIDRYLQASDRWIIVAYDDLDELTRRHMDLFPFLRTPLSFWTRQTRQWERLCCKIFLRDDLYASRHLDFLDACALSDRTVHLEWDTLSLYQLLVQKMIRSGSKAALQYLERTPGLLKGKDELLRYRPTCKESVLQNFAWNLTGASRCGLPYTWAQRILGDMLVDSTPASFLRQFSIAADLILHSKEAMASLAGDQLILPAMLEEAVPAVSQVRLAELLEKNPWLEQLREPFCGLSMPMGRDQFIELLDIDCQSPAQQDSLPGRPPYDIFYALQNLGIVLDNGGSIYIHDPYRRAFGMRQKCVD